MGTSAASMSARFPRRQLQGLVERWRHRSQEIQSLWDHIAASVDQVPLHEWQQAILEERLAAHRRAPQESGPWEEVIEGLQGRLRDRREMARLDHTSSA